MKRTILVFTFLITSLFSFAAPIAPPSIKGIVIDKSTGEPLIGATVTLKSRNGSRPRSTAVGLDGSFAFRDVQLGAYEIEVKYVSYKKTDINFELTSAETRTFKFALESSASALSEVKVAGKTNKESDQSARSTIQKSDFVLNSVSARTIEVSPDITVANVMQRVSGVSIERSNNGEGQYAIIRGMDKRYTYTLINGLKIPSPDNKNRYIPLDIFPADIIERLDVNKSLTPSMEGDAIAGGINLVLKEAPDAFTVKANLGAGLSQSANIIDGQNNKPGPQIASASYGFTKFGNNDVVVRSPRINNGDNYNAVISDFSNNAQHFTNSKMPLGTIGTLSLGGRTNNKKFGALVSLSYQNIYKNTKGVFFQTDVASNNTPLVSDITDRFYSTQQERTSAIGRFDYRFDTKNKINFDVALINLAQNQYRYQSDTSLQLARTGIGQGRVTQTPRSTRNVQNIYNFSLRGDHKLTDDFSINWIANYAKATANENRYSLSLNTGVVLTGGVPVQQPLQVDALKGQTQTFSYNSDQDKSGYLNLVYSPKIMDTKVEFSFGGMYRNKTRNSTYDQYTLALPGTSALSVQYYDGNIDHNTFVISSTQQGTAGDPLNYNFTENVGAGYGQFKFTVGKLQAVGGVRYEHTDQNWLDALDVTKEGKIGSINYYDFLPSLNLKYMLDDKQNIRASYYSAISRPNFYELVPHTTGDPDADYQEVGNPHLMHATADNYDLRYEFFPKALDQFLVGVFYKKIQNPIEYALISSALGYVSQPGNFGTAHNYGFEVDVTKYVRNFGIRANYAFTQSNITTSKQQKYVEAGTGLNKITTVDQTRPLQGQSKNIGNLSLLYKDVKNGLDAQVSAVYTGERINSVSAFLNNDVWQKGFVTLDVSAEKKVYKGLFVYAKATNLLNTPYQLFIKLPYPPAAAYGSPGQPVEYQQSGSNTFVRKDNYQQYYILGVHYKF